MNQAFAGVSALVFVASAALTIGWGASMASMDGTPMPGGWTLSMAWTRMCGQTWTGAAVHFLGMWIVMMVAMMLPSLVPMLRCYREAIGRAGAARIGRLTLLVALGYFAVWTAVGVVAFPIGAALATLATEWHALARVIPLAIGLVVLAGGALQLSAWKARHLACCRHPLSHGQRLPTDARTAWRHGLRLGMHCNASCASLTAILLVIGVMDLRAMAVVMAAITLERFAPDGARIARGIGMVAIAAGLVLIVQAPRAG